MLASTVQFSSYGRFHAYLRLPQQGRFDQVVMDRQSEVIGRSPFPQDPTVCQAARVDRLFQAPRGCTEPARSRAAN